MIEACLKMLKMLILSRHAALISNPVEIMVFLLHGNSKHVAQAYRKVGKKSTDDCSQSNKDNKTDQITEIAPYVRTFF